jgi:hypothetical protein
MKRIFGLAVDCTAPINGEDTLAQIKADRTIKKILRETLTGTMFGSLLLVAIWIS